MDFIDILKDIMNEKGLNQKQLAFLMNLNQSQISEFINGRYKPGYDTIKLMCLKLNVTADYLLGLEDLAGVKID